MRDTLDETQLITLLADDEVLNITLLESLRKHNAEMIVADRRCIIARDRPSNTLLIRATEWPVLEHALASFSEPCAVLLLSNDMAALMSRRFGLIPRAVYKQALYCGSSLLKPASSVVLKSLDSNDQVLVDHNYPSRDRDYLNTRLASHNLWAGYVDEQLIGFIGIHDDGSIGLLYVLEAFRQRGFGTQLLTAMTAYFLARQWRPYSQIVTTNSASLRLHEMVGYTLSSANVTWLTVK